MWKIVLVLLVGLMGCSIDNYIVDNEVDQLKAQQVLQQLKSLEYGAPGSLIDYTPYHLKNRTYYHCKDFAFAFTVLYGEPARVVYNSDHCFVMIGDSIIEPWQQPGSNDVTVYRLKGLSYAASYSVDVLASDAAKIKAQF